MRRASDADRAATANDPKGALIRLLGYLKPYQMQIGAVILLVALYAILNIVGPYLMGVAIDDYIETKDLAGLAQISLAMVATYVGMWLAGAGYGRIMASVAQKAMRQMRQELFEQMQKLSMGYYDKQSAGDLMSRLTNDMDNINLLLSQNLVTLFSSLFTLAGVLITMFVLNVWLTLVALIAFPIMIGMMMVLMKRIGPAFRSQQSTLGKLNGLMEENLSGQRVYIAYNQQGRSLDEFREANNTAREAGIKAQTMAGLIMPLSMGINNLNLALVVGVGAVMVLNGFAGVTIGLITTFTNYARQLSQPLMQMTNLFSAIIAALAGAERIFETLDTEPTVQDKENAPELDVKGDVVFENVDFSYVPGTPILKNVSLSAKSGEMVALVGPTGAGKTTIINVLTRFYDIENGRISIDGAEIRDVQQDSLRNQLGIVLQDTYLFAGSVMENIRYGRLDATDDEIFTAARLANADGFIKRLPDGYDTMLSERASNLSQGQRQLLAIARAILANPRILILDEATSSVDTRTEKLIQDGLHTLMDGRTSFVIAHRLSTIREADQILVVDAGEIVERGTHTDLLSQEGFYYDLYMSQFKGTAVTV